MLWLLHGTFGDHTDWLRKSSIELYACEKDLIVVMPSALNSDYNNWDHCMMGYAMYDFLTEELMPLVYNWFPVLGQARGQFHLGAFHGRRRHSQVRPWDTRSALRRRRCSLRRPVIMSA